MGKQQGRIMFADRLMAGLPVQLLGNKKWPPDMVDMRNEINGCAIVDYNNVYDYFEEVVCQSGRPMGMDYFSCLQPPFEEMWFECGARHDNSDEWPLRSIGVALFHKPDLSSSRSELCKSFPDMDFPQHFGGLNLSVMYEPKVPSAWNNKMQASFVGKLLIVIDEKGAPLCAVPTRMDDLWADETIQNKQWQVEYATLLGRQILPVLLALQFMHCKNIRLNCHEPEQKLSKVFQKRHGKPLLKYHTIEIEPMKQVLETEGGLAHNGLKKALHICRGHFATYTDDKPLFGRKTGTFWKPAHVRGAASEGIVLSDYNVHAPKAGAA